MNPYNDQVVDLGIIIVARNAEMTIARALRSVIESVAEARSCADVSIGIVDTLVVDGSSRDATFEIAASTPGVRVVAQAGLGLANARNQGIDEVRGDVIAFLDADDRWSVDSISQRLRALVRQPECDGVIGRMVAEALPGQPVDERHHGRLGVATTGYTPGALMIRRYSFESIGPFDESLSIASDSEWFVRTRVGHQLPVVESIVLFKGARHDSLSADVVTYRRELLDVSRRFLSARWDLQ